MLFFLHMTSQFFSIMEGFLGYKEDYIHFHVTNTKIGGAPVKTLSAILVLTANHYTFYIQKTIKYRI